LAGRFEFGTEGNKGNEEGGQRNRKRLGVKLEFSFIARVGDTAPSPSRGSEACRSECRRVDRWPTSGRGARSMAENRPAPTLPRELNLDLERQKPLVACEAAARSSRVPSVALREAPRAIGQPDCTDRGDPWAQADRQDHASVAAHLRFAHGTFRCALPGERDGAGSRLRAHNWRATDSGRGEIPALDRFRPRHAGLEIVFGEDRQ
jgi:hypothetical protein